MPDWTREEPHWTSLTWLTHRGPPEDVRYSTEELYLGHSRVADHADLLVVMGPLDLSTTSEVRRVVFGRVLRGLLLLLDLRALTFLGSSGVTLLADLKREVTAAGGRLVLVADQRATLRPLDVRPDDLEVVDSIEKALLGPEV